MIENPFSSKILNSLISQMSAGFIWAEFPTGKITIYNKASETILGHPIIEASDPIDYRLYGGYHKDGRPYAAEEYPTYRALFNDEHVKSEELFYRKNETDTCYLSISATPVYDEDGSKLGAVCVFLDITIQKNLELELSRVYEEEKINHLASIQTIAEFEMLIESSPVGVALFDLFFRYKKLNKVLSRFNGIPIQNHLGKTVHELFGEMGYEVENQLAKVIETKEPISNYEIETKTPGHPDEIRAYLVSFYPVKKADELFGVGMIVVDVSNKKKGELVLKEALSALEKERQQVNQFVSTLTYDIRNPLTAIKLNTSLIAHSFGNKAKLASISEKINSSIGKVSNLISDVLDINKIQAGNKIELLLNEVVLLDEVQTVIEDFVSLHGDRFIISIDKNISGIWSQIDLNRLLTNLISNAIKFGSPETKISISAKVISDSAVVTVHNYGSVIPANETENIFNPFMRGLKKSEESKNSWGLGLAISKGIIEAHHGFIKVQSSEADGTSFIFQLPLNSNLMVKSQL